MKKILSFALIILLTVYLLPNETSEKFCYESEKGFKLTYTQNGNIITGYFEYGGERQEFTGEFISGENKLHLIYKDGTQEFWKITSAGLENPDTGLSVTKTNCN